MERLNGKIFHDNLMNTILNMTGNLCFHENIKFNVHNNNNNNNGRNGSCLTWLATSFRGEVQVAYN